MEKNEIRSLILKIQEILNKEDVVPQAFFRMNDLNYKLVSYVNHITAIYISGNYTAIPAFLSRSLKSLQSENEIPIFYQTVVEMYISIMAVYLRDYERIDLEAYLPPLPEEIVHASVPEQILEELCQIKE